MINPSPTGFEAFERPVH